MMSNKLNVRDLYDGENVIRPLVSKLRIDVSSIEHADQYGAKEKILEELSWREAADGRRAEDIVGLVTSQVCRDYEGMTEPYAETLAYMLIAHVAGIELGAAQSAGQSGGRA